MTSFPLIPSHLQFVTSPHSHSSDPISSHRISFYSTSPHSNHIQFNFIQSHLISHSPHASLSLLLHTSLKVIPSNAISSNPIFVLPHIIPTHLIQSHHIYFHLTSPCSNSSSPILSNPAQSSIILFIPKSSHILPTHLLQCHHISFNSTSPHSNSSNLSNPINSNTILFHFTSSQLIRSNSISFHPTLFKFIPFPSSRYLTTFQNIRSNSSYSHLNSFLYNITFNHSIPCHPF